MADDAYVRIGPRGPVYHGTADSPSAVVFVDLERQNINKLRQVPHDVLRRLGALLVRVDPTFVSDAPAPPWVPSLQQVEKIVERLDLHCNVGLVHQPIGEPPRIEGDIDGEADLLRRARAVELDAVLRFGDAIWKPTDYHFRLPSGDHTRTFVRISNALRQPRDAQVIASWLNRHIQLDLGVVCDTGTMSAVVESLRATMRAAGLRDGPTAVLESYPATALDARQAVREVISNSGKVLALVSVNSSGRVAGRLVEALAAPAGGVRDWALEILVDREPRDLPNISAWLPLSRGDSLLDEQYIGGVHGGCPWCRQPKTARLVPINPTSFDGMLPDQIRQLMPDPSDSRANRSFWQVCSAGDAIGLEEKPDDPVSLFRPSPDQMPIHFRLARLLAEPTYADTVRERLEGLLTRQQEEDAGRIPPGRPLSGKADLVLVPEHEHADANHAALWSNVQPVLAKSDARIVAFPVKGDWSDDLIEEVRPARDILVFALGLVTGGSVTKALTGVQRAKDDEAYDLAALVVHARPSERRAWEALRNSYAHRLAEGWLSYLPDRSPLQEELDVLEGIDVDELSEDETEFFNERKSFASGAAGSGEGNGDARSDAHDANSDNDDATGSADDEHEKSGPSMFWGGRPEDSVSPHSLFGEGINGVTTFVAVGSSMERSRQEAKRRAAPELRVFELKALVVSYFDKLILASVLRWLKPTEAWWGENPEESIATMHELLERRESDDYRIVVPELLLAVAAGKVPEQAALVVKNKAEILLKAETNPRTRAAIRVALSTAERSSLEWPKLAHGFYADEPSGPGTPALG